jgi:hypothetical protein
VLRRPAAALAARLSAVGALLACGSPEAAARVVAADGQFLTDSLPSLSARLEGLAAALRCPPEAARRLARRQPRVLTAVSSRVAANRVSVLMSIVDRRRSVAGQLAIGAPELLLGVADMDGCRAAYAALEEAVLLPPPPPCAASSAGGGGAGSGDGGGGNGGGNGSGSSSIGQGRGRARAFAFAALAHAPRLLLARPPGRLAARAARLRALAARGGRAWQDEWRAAAPPLVADALAADDAALERVERRVAAECRMAASGEGGSSFLEILREALRAAPASSSSSSLGRGASARAPSAASGQAEAVSGSPPRTELAACRDARARAHADPQQHHGRHHHHGRAAEASAPSTMPPPPPLPQQQQQRGLPVAR